MPSDRNTHPTMTRIRTVADGAVLLRIADCIASSSNFEFLNVVKQGHEAVVHV